MKKVKNKLSSISLILFSLSFTLFAGCAYTSTLARDSHVAADIDVDVPYDIVYQNAYDTALDMQLLIVSEDYEKKELRLNSGSYKTGFWSCSGNLIGVFMTEESADRTKIQVTEQIAKGVQIFGCQDKAPEYFSSLLKRIRHIQPEMQRNEKKSETEPY